MEGLGNVNHKVIFGATLSQTGGNNLTRGHFKVGNQANRSMTDILRRLSLNLLGFDRNRISLNGLDASFLVAGNQMDALGVQVLGVGVQLTNLVDLLVKGGWVSNLRLNPALDLMRFQFPLILKSAR